MFYHSWDARKGRYVVGLANSKDGFHWKKQGVVFDTVEAGAGAGAHDALGATARHVVGGLSRVGMRVDFGVWKKQGVVFDTVEAGAGASTHADAYRMTSGAWQSSFHFIIVIIN